MREGNTYRWARREREKAEARDGAGKFATIWRTSALNLVNSAKNADGRPIVRFVTFTDMRKTYQPNGKREVARRLAAAS